MKTKTLICVLNMIDKCLEKIVSETSTEEEINKNLYKYNYVTGSFLSMLLSHWQKRNMKYDWNVVSVNTNIYIQHIIEDEISNMKRSRFNYDYSNRKYWYIDRNMLK